jgi:hypothetical protein
MQLEQAGGEVCGGKVQRPGRIQRDILQLIPMRAFCSLIVSVLCFEKFMMLIL